MWMMHDSYCLNQPKIEEISALSHFIATELRTRAKTGTHQANNLIVLGDLGLALNSVGVVDFVDAIYPDLSLTEISFRLSDHLPLWVEFTLDHSADQMIHVLGLDKSPDPNSPDPLDAVPDLPPRAR